MGDGYTVSSSPKATDLQRGGKRYDYVKFEDKNGNGKLDKGEKIIGSLSIYDFDNDGFDSHDGVKSNHFGDVTESFANSILGNYRDVRNPDGSIPANPNTIKRTAYEDVDGKIVQYKNGEGKTTDVFEITSERTKMCNLGSLVDGIQRASVLTAQEVNTSTPAATASTAGTPNLTTTTTPGATGATGNVTTPSQSGLYVPTADTSATPVTIKADYNKINEAYYSGLGQIQSAMGFYGVNSYQAVNAALTVPQIALNTMNKLLEAYGLKTADNDNTNANATTTTKTDSKNDKSKVSANPALTGNSALAATGAINNSETGISKIPNTTFHKGERVYSIKGGMAKEYETDDNKRIIEEYIDGKLSKTITYPDKNDKTKSTTVAADGTSEKRYINDDGFKVLEKYNDKTEMIQKFKYSTTTTGKEFNLERKYANNKMQGDKTKLEKAKAQLLEVQAEAKHKNLTKAQKFELQQKEEYLSRKIDRYTKQES